MEAGSLWLSCAFGKTFPTDRPSIKSRITFLFISWPVRQPSFCAALPVQGYLYLSYRCWWRPLSQGRLPNRRDPASHTSKVDTQVIFKSWKQTSGFLYWIKWDYHTLHEIKHTFCSLQHQLLLNIVVLLPINLSYGQITGQMLESPLRV